MCDPTLIGVASALSTVVGAAGSLANMSGMRNAQKKQQQEVSIWQQQQRKDRAAEQIRQEDLRKEADKARVAGLDALSADEQKKRQGEEEDRLNKFLQGQGDAAMATPETGAPIATADSAMLSGQQGGDTVASTDLAKKISEAAGGAGQRIKALAKVSAFGDSFGGLGTVNPMIQGATGNEIDKFNEERRGSLGAFATERAVEPVQVSFTPSPLADIFSTALSAGAQGLGNAYGGGGYPAAPAPSTFIGPPKPLPKYLANTNGIF
jgi:hypothetical protein